MTIRRLPRNVTFLGVVSLFNDIASEVVYPIIPFFVTKNLGLSIEALGAIEGFAEAASGVLKGLAGRWSDRVRARKSFVVFGYLLSCISRPLIGISEWWVSVALLRLLDRTGKGFRTSPRDAMIAQSTPPEIRGLAFGFHRALDTGGAVIGPLLTLLLVYKLHWEYKSVFLFTLIPAGLALFALIFFVHEVRPPKREGKGAPIRLPSSRLLWLMLPVAVFSLGKFTDALFILRAGDFGIPTEMVIVLYLVMNVTYASLATPIGSWTDRVGRTRFVPAGFLVYALVSAGFAWAGGPGWAWALFALYGGYYALTEGVVRSLVADFSKPEERGSAFGFYHTTVSLLQFPASFIAGKLWLSFGGRAPFIYGAAMGILAALLFNFVFPMKRGKLHGETGPLERLA